MVSRFCWKILRVYPFACGKQEGHQGECGRGENLRVIHCGFEFKSKQCGYRGVVTSCDKTFEDCKRLGNVVRFGGFPAVDDLPKDDEADARCRGCGLLGCSGDCREEW
jgi:hypothetical protein